MGKGEKRRRDAMGVRPTPVTRSRVLAWADAHSIDISNDEADDLVRRLRTAPSDWTGTDARDGDDKSSDSAGGGQHGRVPAPSRGIPDTPSPDGDRVEPGTADGEGVGRRPLRFDRIYAKPVSVTAGGDGGTVRFPPFDGRVRVERHGSRATVAALDDLQEDDRRVLARSPVRKRLEVHIRCTVPGCGQAFRGWLSPPSASGDEIAVEDTAGERISGGFAGLFAARCPAHSRERRDGMS